MPRSRNNSAPPVKQKVARHPPVVTVEGAQLCAMNAERLLRDSFTVSGPSAVALCELAAEEASKGMMMMFIIWNKEPDRAEEHDDGVDSGLRMDRVRRSRFERFVRKHERYVRGLRGRLWSAFNDHEPKLDFLEFLLKFERVTAPIFAMNPRVASAIPEMVVGPVFAPKSKAPGRPFRELEQFLSSINTDWLRELSHLKNDGFYVGLHEDGTLASPSVGGQVLPWVRGLASLTVAELNFSLAIRPRQRAERPEK